MKRMLALAAIFCSTVVFAQTDAIDDVIRTESITNSTITTNGRSQRKQNPISPKKALAKIPNALNIM